MLKALLAGAAVTFAIAASPALAQKAPGGPAPLGRPYQEVVPSEPVTPAERAQVHRDWEQMSREWDARQRSGAVPPQGSVGPSAYGGFGDTRAGPRRPMPMTGSGLQGAQEPTTPAERAQVRRDWNEMAREWEARQRGGHAPPTGTGQPPLPPR